MTKLSLDNGNKFIAIEDLHRYENEIIKNWDIIANMMNDETQAEVHNKIAPCTEIEFLREYLRLAKNDLII